MKNFNFNDFQQKKIKKYNQILKGLSNPDLMKFQKAMNFLFTPFPNKRRIKKDVKELSKNLPSKDINNGDDEK